MAPLAHTVTRPPAGVVEERPRPLGARSNAVVRTFVRPAAARVVVRGPLAPRATEAEELPVLPSRVAVVPSRFLSWGNPKAPLVSSPGRPPTMGLMSSLDLDRAAYVLKRALTAADLGELLLMLDQWQVFFEEYLAAFEAALGQYEATLSAQKQQDEQAGALVFGALQQFVAEKASEEVAARLAALLQRGLSSAGVASPVGPPFDGLMTGASARVLAQLLESIADCCCAWLSAAGEGKTCPVKEPSEARALLSRQLFELRLRLSQAFRAYEARFDAPLFLAAALEEASGRDCRSFEQYAELTRREVMGQLRAAFRCPMPFHQDRSSWARECEKWIWAVHIRRCIAEATKGQDWTLGAVVRKRLIELELLPTPQAGWQHWPDQHRDATPAEKGALALWAIFGQRQPPFDVSGRGPWPAVGQNTAMQSAS